MARVTVRVSLSTLRTLQRIRAATTAEGRWLAWRTAHPHVRKAAAHLVHDLSNGRVLISGLGQLVLAGADAQRRTSARVQR